MQRRGEPRRVFLRETEEEIRESEREREVACARAGKRALTASRIRAGLGLVGKAPEATRPLLGSSVLWWDECGPGRWDLAREGEADMTEMEVE